MSKEKNFHKLIEEANATQKEQARLRIEERLKNEGYFAVSETQTLRPKKSLKTMLLKLAPIVVSFAVLIIVAVVVVFDFFLSPTLPPENQNPTTNQTPITPLPPDTPSTPSEPSTPSTPSIPSEPSVPSTPVKPPDRYCSGDSYNVNSNIKKHSEYNDLNFLYFNWYDITDYRENFIYQTKEDDEIICYNENMIDINTGSLVHVYIMENNISLDVLSPLDELLINENEINGVPVKWQNGVDIYSVAKFEYEGWKYYIKVEYPIDDNAIIDYVEELLSGITNN